MTGLPEPRFKLEDIKKNNWLAGFHEWLAIHDLIVTILSDGGYDLEIVKPGSPPPSDAGTIFFAKHTKCRRNNVWNIKKSYLPNYVYFDRHGYSGWAEIADSPEMFEAALLTGEAEAETFFAKLCAETIEVNASKIPQLDAAFEKPSRPFVFLPLQLSYDNVIKLSRIKFRLYYETVRDWAMRNGFDLVVKPHPYASRHPITDKVDQESLFVLKDAAECPGVHVTTASIHHIIPDCTTVFCINSGVGLEALLHLKPVVTAGHCDYHWATYAVQDASGIEAIEDIASLKLSPQETKKFLYYFLNEVLVDIRNPERVRQKINTAIADFRVGI